MNLKLKATETSLIVITRDTSAELSAAIRKMLTKLGDDFIVADMEYTNEVEGMEKYSVLIIGTFGTGGIINLDEDDTQNIDDIIIDPQPVEDPNQPEVPPDNPGGDEPGEDPGENPGGNQGEEPGEKDDEQDEKLAELQASFDAYREETANTLASLMEQLQAIQALLQQQQNG